MSVSDSVTNKLLNRGGGEGYIYYLNVIEQLSRVPFV